MSYLRSTARSLRNKKKPLVTPFEPPTCTPPWPIWPPSNKEILPQACGIWSNITDTRMHITGMWRSPWDRRIRPPIPIAQCGSSTKPAPPWATFSSISGCFSLTRTPSIGRCGVSTQQRVAMINLKKQILSCFPSRSNGKYPSIMEPWVRRTVRNRMLPGNTAPCFLRSRMTYAHDDRNLYLAMYAETSTELDIGGSRLAISQTTEYPNKGRIKFHSIQKPASFKLYLRIPTWAGEQFVRKTLPIPEPISETWKLSVNGEAFIKRNWDSRP